MSGDELDPAAVAEMVEALRAVVPDDRVTSSVDIGEDYLHDEAIGIFGVRPAAMVSPAAPPRWRRCWPGPIRAAPR